jgi:hypothetical protein
MFKIPELNFFENRMGDGWRTARTLVMSILGPHSQADQTNMLEYFQLKWYKKI